MPSATANRARAVATQITVDGYRERPKYSGSVWHDDKPILLPATGVVTVFAKNAAGSTVGTASFPWARSGETIKISNPVSANAWLNTMTTATSATFQLDPLNVQEQTGVNSLDVGLSYAGQLKAFQTTVWSSTTSCGRVGTCIEQ